jgi:hypothetical protein
VLVALIDDQVIILAVLLDVPSYGVFPEFGGGLCEKIPAGPLEEIVLALDHAGIDIGNGSFEFSQPSPK